MSVFDAQVQTEAILKHIREKGYVVVNNVSSPDIRAEAITWIDHLVKQAPEARNRGFLDAYHDNRILQLRQDPGMHSVFSAIFDNNDLWVVFDRLIYLEPNDHEENLPLHVDQNPRTHPSFCSLQGLLALQDCNLESGTFACVPQSHKWFEEYAEFSPEHGSYVPYQGNRKPALQAIPLKAGEMVVWDSRTTHSRVRLEDKKCRIKRYAVLITFMPAKRDDYNLVTARKEAFWQGIGVNNLDAGLRATSQPRYGKSLRKREEQFSELGKRIYGFDD